MQKYLFYLIGLIVLFSSCVDDYFDNYSGNQLLVTGNITPDSRANFVHGDGVVKTLWNNYDYIGLFSEEQNNLRYKSKYNGESTEFRPMNEELLPEEGKEVYAYYPSSVAKIDSVPFMPGGRIALYSKAKINNGKLNFQFKHLFSYLKAEISVQDFIKHLSKAQELVDEHTLNMQNAYIEFTSDSAISLTSSSYFNLKTSEICGELSNMTRIYLNGIDMTADSTYTFMIPILPQPEGTIISGKIVFSDENGMTYYPMYNSPYFFEKKAPKGGFKSGVVYKCNDFFSEEFHEETLNVLRSLYQKTGGDQWNNNENWFSNKPLSEWYGFNYIAEQTHKIHSLDLMDNNLRGPFPEELAYLADFVDKDVIHFAFNFSANYLYGPIPEVLKNHKYWNIWGWNAIRQKYTEEGGVDLSNSNLYIENFPIEDIFSETNPINELYDIYKKNKLSQLLFWTINKETAVEEFESSLGNYRVNQLLDFQSKGFGTSVILRFVNMTENQINEFKNRIKERYGNVAGLSWFKRNNHGMMILAPTTGGIYDNNGQYIHNIGYSDVCQKQDQLLARERSDNYLRSIFGEPEEHPIFSVNIYTSTDYSRDGEVITLQKATVGKGIDLTFIGEGYVDKDMATNGLYEQTMNKAMEQFFSYEPYKSFRNRFNVYAVKVISPNSSFMEGTKHAIDGDNAICFNYAQKIPDADKNPPMVAVIYRDYAWDPIYQGRSHTYMYYDDGSFIAHLFKGIDDASELMHEAGGHGFGQLLDEYVEPGNEELTLPNDKKEEMDYRWMQYGHGANVDWRNDASTVKWAHFLNDNRYVNDGLSLYEGAYLYGHGAYRPTKNSMMRYNNAPFNAPSREQIYKRIMQRSEGESWKYDYEEFVKYDAINRNSESRSAIKPLTESEKREYIKNHRPPTFIKGTWRDAMKNSKSKVVVPLR